MCKPLFDELRLCSCGTESQSLDKQDRWTLRRRKKNNLVQGQIMAGHYWSNKIDESQWPASFRKVVDACRKAEKELMQHLQEHLLDSLNSDPNPFDFEYQPHRGDLLELVINLRVDFGRKMDLTLVYTDRWKLYPYESIGALGRMNHPEIANGNIDAPHLRPKPLVKPTDIDALRKLLNRS